MKIFYLLLVFVTLSSCSLTPVKYEPYKERAGGYFSSSHTDDEFIVGFQGNSSNSHQQVLDYSLLRASEVILNSGCRYFRIKETKIGGINKIDRGSILTSLNSNNRTLIIVNSNTSFYNSSSPVAKILVKCSAIKASEKYHIYDAKQLKSSILKNTSK